MQVAFLDRRTRRKRDKLLLKEDYRGLAVLFGLTHLSCGAQELGMYKAILELTYMPPALRQKALAFLKEKGATRMYGQPLPDVLEALT